MKNIHVLSTNKPSKLFLWSNIEKTIFSLTFDSSFKEGYKKMHGYVNQHIYITSDEEIKEGIYTIDLRFNTIVKITTLNIEDCKIGFYDGSLKKIILTTEQELIKDDVQEIPDNFLEWFVKNPSCEEIEVENYSYVDKNVSESEIFTDYTIIIPKEEPKQPKTFKELFANTGIEPTTDENGNIQYNFKASAKKEPKQETLEDVVVKRINDNVLLELHHSTCYSFAEIGAKWQQERSYSEEEVLELLNKSCNYIYDSAKIGTDKKLMPNLLIGWFEQFKKK